MYNDFYNRFIHKYPYDNLHELNLDWIISAVKDLALEMEGFEVANQITYEGPFDITKSYKANAIVIENDIAYISKQPVPAGIPVSNNDYWEVVADFTALIGDLGNRVIALEEDVQKLNYLNQGWSDHVFMYIGDSYGRGRTYPGVYGQSWCDAVTSKLGPATTYNMCVSASAFNSGASSRFGQQLETFKNAHTTAECEAITDIIIAGGYNEVFNPNADIVNDTSTYSAYWMNNYIKNNYPNARVYLAFIGRVPVFGGAQAAFNNFRDVIGRYKDIAAKFNWHYIVGSEYMSHDYEDLTNDGIHFKTAGYLKIGQRLADGINNGSWQYPQLAGERMTLIPLSSTANNSIIFTNAAPDIYNQFTEAGVDIFCLGALLFDCNDTSVDAGTNINIAKYYDASNEKYNHFVAQYTKRITCGIQLYHGNTLIESGVGHLDFDQDGTVKVGLLPNTSSGTATIDRVYIMFDHQVFPYSQC